MGTSNRSGAVRPHGQPAGTKAQPASPTAVEYFDNNGNLREELVDAEAETEGKKLAEAKLRHTQLRRYYEDVLNLRRRLEHECANQPGSNEEEVFRKLRPEFKMLRAKAYYAHKRSSKIFPDAFKDFIERHVHSVQTAAQFRAFCQHFQAVVAFHRVYAKDSE